MTTNGKEGESLSDLKRSFHYGSRVDLNFKFLARLSDEEVGLFFQELLWKLGDAYDHGDLLPLIQHTYAWQLKAYATPGSWSYDDGPFTPLEKPVSQSRLALVTSSGHFVDGDDPMPFGVEDMTQEEAQRRVSEFLRVAPSLSSIPVATAPDRLRVRHAGYDIRGCSTDPNVVFPYQRLQELEAEGVIGELLPTAYSFVGAAAQTLLQKKRAPLWVGMLQEQQVDAALLVPA